MTPNQITDARQERIRRAWKLRVQGLNYDQIAEELGISKGTVHADLKTIRENIEEVTKERAKQELEIELERLDSIVAPYMSKIVDGTATNGDVSTYLKVSERRAKLLGLDISRSEISGPNGAPLQLTAGQPWQQTLLDAGWKAPNEQQVLPGLPQPNQLPGKTEDAEYEVETIEVKE